MRRFGEEKKKNCTFKLYQETIDDLKETAKRVGVKKNSLVELAIINEVEKLDKVSSNYRGIYK